MEAFEQQLLDWILERGAQMSPGLIGDDMAQLRVSAEDLLVSSDMIVDGVHVDSTHQPLDHIGRKAVACALSDCAAMAVRPRWITLSLALPQTFSLAQTQRLLDGAFALAEQFDTKVVGGDTTRGSKSLTIDVVVLAEPFEGIRPVPRGPARIGDGVYVTGTLGGSRLGRHLMFTPRLTEAREIAGAAGDRLHAMMDISDGLSLDLWRMCRHSGTGARLDAAALESVADEAARTLARDEGRGVLQHVLGDGEDFELLMALAGEPPTMDVPITRVGTITESAGLVLATEDGRVEPLQPRGYLH